MMTGQEYKDSLRKRNIKVYFKGQLLKSDEVIDNSGAPDQTHRQVDLLVRRIRERRAAD